jgi:hypothetical protein
MRAHSETSFYSHLAGLITSMAYFPEVDYRYFIAPSVGLSPIPMNFERKHLDKIMALGIEDAKKAVALGPHGYRDILINYFNDLEFGRDTKEFSDLLDEGMKKTFVSE